MKTKIFTTMILVTFASVTAFGAAKSKAHEKMKPIQMTAEQRQSMATAHEKMAACLRSDKPLEECHKEMMESCHGVMGKEHCSMMGHKGMMMQDKEEKKDDGKK